jgi:hypothetical protein
MTSATAHASTPFARAIQSLPLAFRADRARGGSARVHIATTGPEPGNWMLTVSGGKCVIEKGATPGMRPVVHVPSDVWVLIARRQLDPLVALDQGLLHFEGEPELFHKLRSWFD